MNGLNKIKNSFQETIGMLASEKFHPFYTVATLFTLHIHFSDYTVNAFMAFLFIPILFVLAHLCIGYFKRRLKQLRNFVNMF